MVRRVSRGGVHLEEGVSLPHSPATSWPLFFVPVQIAAGLVLGFFLEEVGKGLGGGWFSVVNNRVV